MVLPSSGQISLNDIHVEVGGTSGTACTIADSDILAICPTPAQPHAFNEWYGASAESIGEDWGVGTYTWTDNLSNEAESDFGQVVVQVNSNGTFFRQVEDNGAKTQTYYDWCSTAPSTSGSAYEVKYTYSGTALSTNQTATNTFEDLGTSRYYALTDANPNNAATSSTLTVTIRKDGLSATEVSQVFSLSANFGSGIAWTTTADTVQSYGITTTEVAGFKLINDGTSQETNPAGTYISWSPWSVNPGSTTGSEYEVYWNFVSGTALDIAPTEDTWLTLGTSRTWQFNAGKTFQVAAIIDVTVRCLNNSATEVTKRVTIFAEREP